MFSNYLYTSSTSKSFRNHFILAAKKYSKELKLNKKKSFIIDIGSNDGIALKPFLDMNVSAEYRYNEKVSAFIRFNNFTAKRYQFWTNTPVQSINIFGGVTLSF